MNIANKIRDTEVHKTSRVKISVFTSPTCPHCPSAIKLANEIKHADGMINVIEYNSGNSKGQKQARKFGIMSVPTVLVKGSSFPNSIVFRGTPFKNDLLKAIRVARGEEELEEEKTFTENILEFIRKKFKIRIKF